MTPAQRYRRASRPLAFLAFLCGLSGFQFFLDPSVVEKNAIGHALHGPVDDMWYAAFLVGGLLTFLGAQRPDPRFERAGLILLTCALLLNGIAVFVVVGVRAYLALGIYIYLVAVFVERVVFITGLDRRSAEGFANDT